MSAHDARPRAAAPDAAAPVDAAGHPWAALAPAYALGALDADEHEAFAAHLATCAACTADARAYGEVAAGLAHAAAAEPAPPALRARILAEVRRAADAPPPRPAPAPHRRAPAWAARAPWLAAAASLVLAAGSGTAWRGERDARARAETALRRRAGAEQAGGRALFETYRRDLAVRDSALRALNDVIAAVTEPDVRTARLASTGAAAAVRLTWNRPRGLVVVTATALAAPGPGRTYQLWGIRGRGAPQSLGTFAPDGSGRLRAVLRVPAGAAMDAVAVTDEPEGGSVRATTPPLLLGTLGA